jgi:hypothetical protein
LLSVLERDARARTGPAAALAAPALALAAPPADATFPGRNGPLVATGDYGRGFTQAYLRPAGTWSPDGKLIAYYRERGGEFCLWAVSWRSGRAGQITDQLTDA